jgi:hypothetical protein
MQFYLCHVSNESHLRDRRLILGRPVGPGGPLSCPQPSQSAANTDHLRPARLSLQPSPWRIASQTRSFLRTAGPTLLPTEMFANWPPARAWMARSTAGRVVEAGRVADCTRDGRPGSQSRPSSDGMVALCAGFFFSLTLHTIDPPPGRRGSNAPSSPSYARCVSIRQGRPGKVSRMDGSRNQPSSVDTA